MLGTMGCRNFGEIMAVRFLLGFFEAPIVPAMVSYTALFYTRQEGTARTLIWGAMQVSRSMGYDLTSRVHSTLFSLSSLMGLVIYPVTPCSNGVGSSSFWAWFLSSLASPG